MRTKTTLAIVAVVALAAGSDCQRQATRLSSFGLEPRTMTVPAAMGPLIPEGAVALVYMSSIDEAERSLLELRPESPSDSSRIDLAGTISERLQIPVESIDRKRPVALVVSLVDLGRPIPMPTVILPVRNEREALEQLGARAGKPEPLGNRGWVGVPLLAGYERGTGTPPIAKDLQAGVFAVRLQTDRILEVAQPYIDAALKSVLAKAAAEETGAHGDSTKLRAMQARTAAALAEQVLDLLRASETLDCGIRIREGNLAVAYKMATTPESRNVAATAERAQGLAELARCLPDDYPVMGLVAMEFAKPLAFYKNLYSGVLDETMREVPEPFRDYTRSMMEQSVELYQLTDDQMFHAMRFSDSGTEIIQVFATQNAAKFVEECRKIFGFELLESAGLGQVEPEEPVVVDGVEIQGLRVHLDIEKLMKLHGTTAETAPDSARAAAFTKYFVKAMLGGETMIVRFAAVGDKVLVVTHPERGVIEGCIAALKRSSGGVPPSLRTVQRLAKDPLCFWARADIRDLLLPMLEAAPPDSSGSEEFDLRAELAAMEALPVTAYMTAGHQAYQGAFNMDVESFVTFAKLLGKDPASPDPEEEPGDSEP